MKKTNINLLDLKPKHNRAWEENDPGCVSVLQPRFSNRIMKKIFEPVLKNPDIRIRLDEYGSFVWKLCDGEHSISDISQKLKTRFGESIEPVIDRLAQFMKYLERYEFIKYDNLPDEKIN